MHSVKGYKELMTGNVRNRLSFGARFFDNQLLRKFARLRYANAGERAFIEQWAADNPDAQLRYTITIDEILNAHGLSEAEAMAQGLDYWNDNLIDLDYVQANGSATSTDGLLTADVFSAHLSDLITFGDDRRIYYWVCATNDVEESLHSRAAKLRNPSRVTIFRNKRVLFTILAMILAGFANYATSYSGNRAVDPIPGFHVPPKREKHMKLELKWIFGKASCPEA